jgi:hypothetical protein
MTLEDFSFQSGVAGSTAVQILDKVDVNIMNDYVYTAVLLVTLAIGLKKLFNKDKIKH